MTGGNANSLIRYRGRVGGGVWQEISAPKALRMALDLYPLKSSTDEEVETLRSVGRYDAPELASEPGVPFVVFRRPGATEAPSQCDREAIVLGHDLTAPDARTPSEAGGSREGPTQSWWRTKLGHDWAEEEARETRLREQRGRDGELPARRPAPRHRKAAHHRLA